VSHPTYFHYWGKAGHGAVEEWHPLPFHMLDCAAVCIEMLERDRFLTRRLALAAGLTEEEIRGFLPYLVALHDLGKFADGFQWLRADIASANGFGRPVSYSLRHDSAGYLLWRKVLVRDERFARWLPATGSSGGLTDPDTRLDLFSPWLRASAGHHGQPPIIGPHEAGLLFSQRSRTAAASFLDDVLVLFQPPGLSVPPAGAAEESFALSSWLVAGLVVVCDWIGSNVDWFPYDRSRPLLADYWSVARERAARAVEEAGLLPVGSQPLRSFSEVFPTIANPSPLQRYVDLDADVSPGPQLFVLEDVTGSGKTEAALQLAHRMMVAEAADGIFFALPTMATSNQMYERLAASAARLFPEEASLSTILAHSGTRLRRYIRSTPTDAPETAEVHCAAWIADNRKKAFLATLGAGTVDQALLAVMASRHSVLRLAGLQRKVLIIDEVHSYDPYMNRLIETLLEFHAALGGSAIVLSATLAESAARRLIGAFHRGCSPDLSTFEIGDSTAFPLATYYANGKAARVQIDAASRSQRSVSVEWLHESQEVLDLVLREARAGKCVCWIRNSVDDALEAYDALAASGLPREPLLFHARFIAEDRDRIERQVLKLFGKESGPEERRGTVLVATQVVEQSLDLDFDVLITDLAPIDLLIQRAGRLQRHQRRRDGSPASAGDERRTPRLHLLSPPWTTQPGTGWVRDSLQRTSFVYPDHGRLWLTAAVLRQQGAIVTPDESRLLIDAVYGPEAYDTIPETLERSTRNYDGRALAEQALASLNSLRLAQAYSTPGTAWLDDHSARTRLGEETVTLRLAREEAGVLLPIAERSWLLSDLSVRRAKIARPAVQHDPAADEARAGMPDLGKWCELIALRREDERWSGEGVNAKGERVRVMYHHERGLWTEN
jgi:CRISPR-associated endonuclease/helicase Cas3